MELDIAASRAGGGAESSCGGRGSGGGGDRVGEAAGGTRAGGGRAGIRKGASAEDRGGAWAERRGEEKHLSSLRLDIESALETLVLRAIKERRLQSHDLLQALQRRVHVVTALGTLVSGETGGFGGRNGDEGEEKGRCQGKGVEELWEESLRLVERRLQELQAQEKQQLAHSQHVYYSDQLSADFGTQALFHPHELFGWLPEEASVHLVPSTFTPLQEECPLLSFILSSFRFVSPLPDPLITMERWQLQPLACPVLPFTCVFHRLSHRLSHCSGEWYAINSDWLFPHLLTAPPPPFFSPYFPCLTD
ncbi:unnamed protein product [Closterium sp. Naga37s-1]|nr:unnamed protein product [Closterium sp. Naga37s-1]